MGRKNFSRGLQAATAITLLAGLPIIANPAQAQTAASVDDIIVTATRRDESAISVPLSLVAVDRARLDSDRVASMADISRTTPGLSLRNGWGDATKISIRGIAATAGTATTGIYIDDTPIQVRSLGAADIVANAYPEIFDLERVEVLRGPQGTLFGAGSEGGTVRFITSEPALSGSRVYAKASAATTRGGAASWSLGASASGALVEDRIGISLTGFTKKDGGWVDRAPFSTGTTVDKNINRRTATSLRGALALKPSETLTLTPSIFYQKTHRHDTDQYWELLSNPDDGRYVSGAEVAQPARDRFYLPALKGELDLGGVTLITNTSWFNRRNTTVVDYSYHIVEGLTGIFSGGTAVLHVLPVPSFTAPSNFVSNQKAFTQEARLQSTDTDAALSWTIGAFYQNARINTRQDIVSPLIGVLLGPVPLLPGGRPYASTDSSKDKQLAAFGQLDWKATDQLTLTVGGRVSRTKVSFANAQDGPINGVPTSATGSSKETPFTPKFGASFKPDTDTLVYANAAKGFRPGGGNPGVPAPFCAADLGLLGVAQVPTTYKSDSVWSYEVGAKKGSHDGRLNVQASAFLIDWKDIQQSIPLFRCGFAYTANLGKAVSKGFDLQLAVQPVQGLTLRGSVAYMDAHYTGTVLGGTNNVPLATRGDDLPGPPWQVRVSGNYDFPVGENKAFVQLNYDYASGYERLPTAFNTDPTIKHAQATHFVGGRTGIGFGPLQAALFVDNIFNSTDATFRTRDSVFSNYYRRIGFRPRTVGIELIYRR